MKKVLITGHTGFLGRILFSKLTQNGINVIGLQDSSNTKIDITSPFILPDTNFDLIIHCAGKAHTLPRSEKEQRAFYKVNLEGTKNLCSAIDSLETIPKSFIFISSVSVYGLDKGENINEKSPLLGKSPYAESKILAERFLSEWADKNNVILGILRLPLLAGSTPPGNLGSMIRGIRTGKYASIGKADSKKSIVLAEDIATIIPRLSEIGGTFNLTDGYDPSIGELEFAIASALDRSSPIKIPLPAARLIGKIGDIFYPHVPFNSNNLNKILSTLTFNDSNARNKLGWQPTRVLDKIIEIV